MSIRIKDYIDTIKPYEPGKPIEEVQRELGLNEIIKVASNENCLGLSDKVKKAIINNIDEFYRYPDGGSWALREKIAAYHGIDKDEIVLGNGSNEIIEFIAKGFIERKDEVISSQYAFLVYPLITKVSDGIYIEVPAEEKKYNLRAIADTITDKTKVVFLANPNNPTGLYFTKSEFDEFLKRVPKSVLVCLDEAYIDFATADDFPNGIDYFRNYNVIVLRTFSKAFGLAGFRIGYAVINRALARYFNKIRQPFNVNSLAQCAACAVLDDGDYLEKSKRVIADGKTYLYKSLEDAGFEYYKSQTNFILVDVKVDANQFFNECLKKGIIVRSMKAYKLDTFIRITIGTESENKKVMKVIDEVAQSLR